jgi:hypothetical protein
MIAGGSKGIEKSRNDGVSTKRSMSWCVHIEVVGMYYLLVHQGYTDAARVWLCLVPSYGSSPTTISDRRAVRSVGGSSCTLVRSTSFPHNRILCVGTRFFGDDDRSCSHGETTAPDDEKGSDCLAR